MSDMDDYIEQLILEGAIEVSGIDAETGEFLYGFTPKMAKINPGMYEESLEFFYMSILSLWERGFLNMNIEESNPKVTLTELAFDEDAISKLSVDDRHALRTIIEAMSNN